MRFLRILGFSNPKFSSRKSQFDEEQFRAQFENELRREADLIRLEINDRFNTGDFESKIKGSKTEKKTEPTAPAVLPGFGLRHFV